MGVLFHNMFLVELFWFAFNVLFLISQEFVDYLKIFLKIIKCDQITFFINKWLCNEYESYL